MFRRILFVAVAVFGAAMFALSIAEVALRISGLASPPVAVTADERTFTELPGIFFPSRTRTDRRIPGLAHDVSINTLGFRGDDVSRNKPAGEVRIVMIGDSFTWGDYVNDDETLPSQVQRLLRPHCGPVTVLNFGVGGTSIDGQLEMLSRATALAPDAVILVYHDNDVLDMRAPTYWTAMAESRARKSEFPASLMYGLLRNTALWSLTRQTQTRLRAAREVPVYAEGFSAGPPPDLDSLKTRYQEGLREFATRARAMRLPLLVTAYPSHLALTDPESTPFGWFERLAQSDSFRFVSARDALVRSGYSKQALYLLPLDGHASSTGYRVVAEAISAEIRSAPLGAVSCHAQALN